MRHGLAYKVSRLGIGLALVAAGVAYAQTGAEQPKPAAASTLPGEFEVTTVKPTPAANDGRTHINYPPGGGFSASNITPALLMQWACDMPQKRILNAPDWFTSMRFDFQGKSDLQTDEVLRKMPSIEANAAKRHMVERLLEDRFHLTLRRETELLSAFDLVPARSGPKLQASQTSGRKYDAGRTSINGTGMTSAALAELLSQVLDEVVVDKTGLDGRYDIKLQWAPDDAVDASLPPLPMALEEQLGLRIVKAKEPLPVLVVEHAELPSAN